MEINHCGMGILARSIPINKAGKDAHPTRMPTPQESLFLQDAYLNKIVK